MNWKNLLFGLGFLFGSFIIYKLRKSGYIESDEYQAINKMKGFQAWVVIIMSTIAGIAFIINSFS